MKTVINLPDPLFREIEARAATQGVKPQTLIPKLVEAGLARSHVKSRPARRKRSRLPIIRKADTGKPMPLLSTEEIRAIEIEEDVAKHGRSARR